MPAARETVPAPASPAGRNATATAERRNSGGRSATLRRSGAVSPATNVPIIFKNRKQKVGRNGRRAGNGHRSAAATGLSPVKTGPIPVKTGLRPVRAARNGGDSPTGGRRPRAGIAAARTRGAAVRQTAPTRKSWGVIPTACLNTRVKCCGYWNPN